MNYPARTTRKEQIMIRRERLTATLEGDFVVFLIGLRVNNLLKLHNHWIGPAIA